MPTHSSTKNRKILWNRKIKFLVIFRRLLTFVQSAETNDVWQDGKITGAEKWTSNIRREETWTGIKPNRTGIDLNLLKWSDYVYSPSERVIFQMPSVPVLIFNLLSARNFHFSPSPIIKCLNFTPEWQLRLMSWLKKLFSCLEKLVSPRGRC